MKQLILLVFAAAALADYTPPPQRLARALDPAQHPPLRVGKGRDLAHALGHAGNALRRQGQTVDHHVAVALPRGVHVQAVGLQNFVLLREEPVRDGEQGGVFPFP